MQITQHTVETIVHVLDCLLERGLCADNTTHCGEHGSSVKIVYFTVSERDLCASNTMGKTLFYCFRTGPMCCMGKTTVLETGPMC